ncbi:hypothetical protein FACS1894137_00480 [Spirochaetia bacterium]|nr:hypothetical protein FACS1894137_00480 [Spirochaetia bacterium]
MPNPAFSMKNGHMKKYIPFLSFVYGIVKQKTAKKRPFIAKGMPGIAENPSF